MKHLIKFNESATIDFGALNFGYCNHTIEKRNKYDFFNLKHLCLIKIGNINYNADNEIISAKKYEDSFLRLIDYMNLEGFKFTSFIYKGDKEKLVSNKSSEISLI